jgi:hypothetical protein
MALKIGELLLQRGLISREQLDRALAAQRRWGTRVGVALVRLGFLEEGVLISSLAEQLGIAAAPATAMDRVAPDVIARVPAQVARKHKLIPISVQDDVVHVCLADPQNLIRIDAIAFTLGCAIQPFLATELLIDKALERYYPGDPDTTVAAEEPATLPGMPPPAPAPDAAVSGARDQEVSRPARQGAQRQQEALQALARALETVKKENGGGARELIELPDPDAEGEIGPDSERVTVAERPPPASLDPFGRLAAATSRADIGAALTAFFTDFFPTFCVLETEGGTARCVGLRLAGAAPTDGSSVARLPFVEAEWIREAVARTRLAVTEQVKDPHLILLLERVGLPVRGVVVAPVTDAAAVCYVLLGHGLGEAELKPLAGKLRPYLLAAADAVRMTALRDQIIRRGRADPADRAVSDVSSTRHLDFSGTATDPALRQSMAGIGLAAGHKTPRRG